MDRAAGGAVCGGRAEQGADDCDLGASFGTTQVAGAVGSTYNFDLTQLVTNVVSGAYGSRYTRLALIDTGGSSSGGSYKEFYSTRATNTAVRPKLVITYTTSTSTTSTSTSTSTPSTASSGSGTGIVTITPGTPGSPVGGEAAYVIQFAQGTSDANEAAFAIGTTSFAQDGDAVTSKTANSTTPNGQLYRQTASGWSHAYCKFANGAGSDATVTIAATKY